jgi:prephenate dehydratase
VTQLSSNSILGTLGPAYSFHDILYQDKIAHLQVRYFSSFDEIFEALQKNDIQTALVATSNSIHGKVGKNAETISNLNLAIIQKFELPISLHLAAKSSTPLSDITKVYAHPVAWNECQLFLDNYNIEHLHSSSNSQALIDLEKDAETRSAAISGREAINNSTLQLIKEDIHDTDPNITSFALVAKK